jgi:hypothetical protein
MGYWRESGDYAANRRRQHFNVLSDDARGIIINALGLGSWGVYVAANATFQSGYLVNESNKTTSGGSMLYIRCSDSYSPSLPLFYIASGGICYLYSSKIRGHTNLNVGLNCQSGTLRVWNSQFDITRQVIWGAWGTVDWFNVFIMNAEKFAEGSMGTVDTVTITNSSHGICFSYGSTCTVKNLTGKNNSYAVQLWDFYGTANLVNAAF